LSHEALTGVGHVGALLLDYQAARAIRRFEALMDELVIYNRDLTAEELQELIKK
jgi:hypothetical protein